MTPERITTRCPACGCQTLFIGSGGHLVCSLIDCPSPGVERKIAELQRKAERYDAIAIFFQSETKQPPSANAVDPADGTGQKDATRA